MDGGGHPTPSTRLHNTPPYNNAGIARHSLTHLQRDTAAAPPPERLGIFSGWKHGCFVAPCVKAVAVFLFQGRVQSCVGLVRPMQCHDRNKPTIRAHNTPPHCVIYRRLFRGKADAAAASSRRRHQRHAVRRLHGPDRRVGRPLVTEPLRRNARKSWRKEKRGVEEETGVSRYNRKKVCARQATRL